LHQWRDKQHSDYSLVYVKLEAAFPNAALPEEEIYMRPPPELGLPSGSFLKLKRALYGLKQASRAWNQELTQWLMQHGFRQLVTETCIFINDAMGIYLLIYVDDILIAAPDFQQCQPFIDEFDSRFTIKVNDIDEFLGVKINHDTDSGITTLSQEGMINQIVLMYDKYIVGRRARQTPIDHGIKLSKRQAPQDEQEKNIMQTLPYRNLTGALLYVANTTRPDIMFAVNKCAQFMSNPGTKHWEALLNILVYLKTNNKLMIKYSRHVRECNILSANVDADHGGDVDTMRSTTGYTVLMNDGLISWGLTTGCIVA
jgi:Reverse transcriptase (RNA-dependent DNA polymerase)